MRKFIDLVNAIPEWILVAIVVAGMIAIEASIAHGDPGAVDVECIPAKVCQPNYTVGMRPPARVTTAYKAALCRHRGEDVGSCLAKNEGDHYMPMELCGDPAWHLIDGHWILVHPENFWLEPWPEARRKDVDETRLHRAVCAGKISIEDAREQIRSRWTIHQ